MSTPSVPLDIYAGPLQVVQPRAIQYMGTPSMPSDICSPATSGPAKSNSIYLGAPSVPPNIYVGLLRAVQPRVIQYMGAPSVSADIYVRTATSGPANSNTIYGRSKHASRHICVTAMSSPANRDTIYGFSKHASQHICGPDMSGPANRDTIFGCSKCATQHICVTTISGPADKWIICTSPAIQSSKSIDCYCIFYSFFQYSCTLFEMSSNQLMNHWFPA